MTDALLILVKGAGKKGLGWDPAKKMMAKVCLRRLHCMQTTRLQERMVVGGFFFSMSGPFGPSQDTTTRRWRRGMDVASHAVFMITRGRPRVQRSREEVIPAQVDAFLQSLIDFKGEDIAEDLVKRVQPYLDDPVFSYDKMKSKSSAAANLLCR